MQLTASRRPHLRHHCRKRGGLSSSSQNCCSEASSHDTAGAHSLLALSLQHMLNWNPALTWLYSTAVSRLSGWPRLSHPSRWPSQGLVAAVHPPPQTFSIRNVISSRRSSDSLLNGAAARQSELVRHTLASNISLVSSSDTCFNGEGQAQCSPREHVAQAITLERQRGLGIVS